MSREDLQRVLEKERKEASRLRVDGRVELTGATDADGILVELSAYDIERLSREEIDRYQERRRKQIAQKEATRAEEGRFAQFEEAFVREGGTKTDARSAYKAMRNQEAERAARLADEEARQQHQSTTKAAI
jgi:hypothetical protein